MSDPNNVKERIEEEVGKKISGFVKDTYRKSMIFLMIFSLFTINLFALSLSLHCNTNSTTFIRLSSALFAFMFGFFYILVNYYFYRAGNKQSADICKVCSDNPFPFMTSASLGSVIAKEVKKTAQAIKG